MTLRPGTILASAQTMDDPNFQQTVLYITEVNPRGAIAFVINKPFERRFNDLLEFRHSRDVPLFVGGPVEKESLFLIHRRPDLVGNGRLVRDNIHVGGDFQEAVKHINNKNLPEGEFKLFVGYCGWDPGELEVEITEGSWIIADEDAVDPFEWDMNGTWDLLAR